MDEIEIDCDSCGELRFLLKSGGYCEDCKDYLCASCLQKHPRLKATRNHRVLIKEALFNHYKLTMQTAGNEKKKHVECEIHRRRYIELYCEDHDCLICSICTVVYHRSCVNIKYTADILNHASDQEISSSYKRVTKLLKDIENGSLDKTESKEDNIIHLEEHEKHLLEKVLHDGFVSDRCFRINIIGYHAQGKTALARRLLNQTLEGIESTNGIDVHIRKCKIEGERWESLQEINTDVEGILNLAEKIRFENLKKKDEHVVKVKSTFETIREEKMNSVSEVALYKRLPEKEVPKSNTETNSIEYKRWEHLQEIDTDVEGFLNLAEKIRFENLKKKDEHVVKVKSAFETIREEKMNSVSEVALYERLPETEAPKSNNETNSIEYKVSEILKEKPKDRNTENQLLTSIWDYGGQYIYYATHQIFHSADAVYILVFDLTKDLERYIVDCDFPERNETMKNCLKFWVDSVDAVVGNEECTQPTIILVGTHKNSFQGDIERKFEEVVDIFKETGVRNHIYKQHFAVDNTDFHDEVFEQLRKVIHGIGKKHLEKRKIPAKWIPLEFALLSKRGSNILTLKEVETIDKSNKHPIRDEKEIKLFLKYHHGKGTVIYFDEDILDKFIVVNPVYLIDAFKCIISSNRFCKWDRDLHPLWTKLVSTAVLENKLVYEVWRQHGFQMHIDVLLLFLQRHRVLSEILLIDDDGMVSKQNKYFIPSMVKQNCTEEVLLRFIGRKQRTTVLLGYRLDKSSTSGHVYERITTAVLGKWSPIWFNGNLMVFRNAGLYRLDKQHAGVIFLREGKGLEILVINQCESQKVNKRVSDRFRRYVESAITFEFSRYCHETRRQQYSYYFVCNHSEHIRISGSHNIYEIEEVVGNDPISCPENLGHSVHPMQARQEWFLAENIFQDEDIPDRNVTDEDLSRIAESLGENWQLLGIRLGLRPDELQRIRMDHETSGIATTMFYMLYTWKNISIETGGDISFSKLISTMSDCEQLVVNWDKVRNIVDNF